MVQGRRLALVAPVTCLVSMAGCRGDDGGPPPPAAGALQVATLSSESEYVSGGSTLVQVTVPATMDPASVKVTLNGADVTSSFQPVDANVRTLRGLVVGLTPDATKTTGSPNVIVASDTTGASTTATLNVSNYPISGPILSGPHISPDECRTVDNGLGDPLDADCSATKTIFYPYRASDATFKLLVDPTAPRPTDLANTTTNDAVTVPYIVRIESGTVNRSVYNIAMLDNPTVAAPVPTTFTPGPGWNRKVVIGFGGGAGAAYNQGVQPFPTALSHTELSRGFAFVNSTELVNLQHSNPHLQGETAMMLKAHRPGEPGARLQRDQQSERQRVLHLLRYQCQPVRQGRDDRPTTRACSTGSRRSIEGPSRPPNSWTSTSRWGLRSRAASATSTTRRKT